jgi:alkanesulfonate monooxygenase SsuD/methylene tetrahydromethanopterin reductase-like flavin-dependent oxidoreductase (luciferase family)
MDFGVVFPTTQIGTDPAVIRDFVQTAEGLGYRRLLVYDHVLGARYHGVPDVQVAGPAAHIAALGEFLRVVGG